MKLRFAAVPLLAVLASNCSWNVNTDNIKLRSGQAEKEAWHRGVLATTFWVGEPGNEESAWDPNWLASFGGVDDPDNRDGWLPAAFRPRQNPFYCALPLKPRGNARESRGSWVEVRAGGRSGYCQWEDVGPWHTDDEDYVLGPARPRAEAEGKAGIDLSPAVRDYLGLTGKDPVDWRFARQVPDGPWLRISNPLAGAGARTHDPDGG